MDQSRSGCLNVGLKGRRCGRNWECQEEVDVNADSVVLHVLEGAVDYPPSYSRIENCQHVQPVRWDDQDFVIDVMARQIEGELGKVRNALYEDLRPVILLVVVTGTKFPPEFATRGAL